MMNKLLNNKQFLAVVFFVGVGFVLAGILMLTFGIPSAISGFYKAMILLLSLVCLALGGVAIILTVYSQEKDPHFFRYNGRECRNIPLDELSFEHIDACMTRFVRMISESHTQLWEGDIFAGKDENTFGYRDVMRPVLAYKMLYDLIRINRDEAWELFTSAQPELIEDLTAALEQAGEEAMPKALRSAYNDAANVHDIEWLKDYLTHNEKYIRRRMDGYVRKNDAFFY